MMTLLHSCAVSKAASAGGATVKEIQGLRTRSQVLALTEKILRSEQNEEGDLVEIYRVKVAKGSAARAWMHGILDIVTWGAWEVVGTPMEGVLTADEFFTIRVTYDEKHQVKEIALA